jgi:hypothetical protein
MTAYQPTPSTQKWIEHQICGLPARWQKKLVNRWHSEVPGGRNFDDVAGRSPEFVANHHLAVLAERLGDSRLPLDASDSTICQAADALAGRAADLGTIYHDIKDLRAAMERIAHGQDVAPPAPWDELTQKGVQDGPAVARMTDPLWWRRNLRRVHAHNVEGAAIALGYVNRGSDPYVSNESVYRRAQQNERNAKALAETIATNEAGQEYSLAELAAKGPANKAIRRAELMTRISGFERIALDMKHAGLFFTVTCPSRMHKWRSVKNQPNRAIENPAYDGTLPGQAQKYLTKVWARIRAKLARQDISVYGFRIAEPNHDGTPHWHLLVFVDPARLVDLQATVWKYALQDSPDERGAHQHRVDFKDIDPGRGSAAGYIAKYVAKNIDGYRLETDLIGNDAIETSHRVEAWATTWGIRQFQQVGGPPVGPWRELRRVTEIPAGAPQHLIDAHRAANKISDLEAGTVKAVAWDRYCRAQGGGGRRARIKVAMVQPDGLNRYGEGAAKRPMGVETREVEHYTPEHMLHMRPAPRIPRTIEWIVESARHVWAVERKGKPRLSPAPAPAASRPWTCVNNCTQDDEAEALRLDFLRGCGGENPQKPESWPGETAYRASQ